MNKRFLFLRIPFVGFLGYTVYVIVAREVSLFTYLGALRPNSWATQILVDLYSACTLLCINFTSKEHDESRGSSFTMDLQ